MCQNFFIVLASGSGERFGSDGTPKHLTLLKNTEIISWTVNTLLNVSSKKKVAIVVQQESLIATKAAVGRLANDESNFINFVIGGSERMVSFFNGLNWLFNNYKISDDDIITLVDANRPLTSPNQIGELFTAAQKIGASCLARPLINGVAYIIDDVIYDVPPKNSFVEFVTPESVKFKFLRNYLDNYLNFYSLVEVALKSSLKPKIVVSNDLNLKLTYREDLNILEDLIKKHEIATPLLISS